MGETKKLLFVKIGAIGDVVMTLPAVRYAVSQGAEVTWVCGKTVFPLVKAFSGVQKIIVVDENPLLKGSLFQKIFRALLLNARLFGRRYDKILIGHSDSRYKVLAKTCIGPKKTFHPTRTDHYTRDYFKFMNDMDPSPETLKSSWPPAQVPWKGKGKKRIALSPGGARNVLADSGLRRWPLEYYVSLAKLLIADGYTISLVGAEGDKWILPPFEELLQSGSCENELGRHGLLELMERFSDCELLVTHDSGPLHLGGLAGVPILGLFGPTLMDWFFPIYRKGLAISANPHLPCQPCYDGKNYAPCLSNDCLKILSPQMVYREVKKLVGEGNPVPD